MISFNRTAVAAGLAAIMAVGAVPAQAQSYSDTQPVSAFTEQNVMAVLAQLGAQTKIVEDGDARYVRADMKSGLIALYEPTACGDSGGKCIGLNIMAVWERPADWSDSKLLKALSDFENKYSYIKAGVLQDGSVYLQRYIICDYGTYMGNLRVEATTFDSIAVKFADVIEP